jgi:hypothetical protein
VASFFKRAASAEVEYGMNLTDLYEYAIPTYTQPVPIPLLVQGSMVFALLIARFKILNGKPYYTYHLG